MLLTMANLEGRMSIRAAGFGEFLDHIPKFDDDFTKLRQNITCFAA